MYIIQGKVIRAYGTVITYSYKFKVIIYIWQTKVTLSEYLGFSEIQFLIKNCGVSGGTEDILDHCAYKIFCKESVNIF